MSSCAKEKETLKETFQEEDIKNRNQKVNFVIKWLVKKYTWNYLFII